MTVMKIEGGKVAWPGEYFQDLTMSTAQALDSKRRYHVGRTSQVSCSCLERQRCWPGQEGAASMTTERRGKVFTRRRRREEEGVQKIREVCWGEWRLEMQSGVIIPEGLRDWRSHLPRLRNTEEKTWRQMVNSVEHHHSLKDPWILKDKIRVSGRRLLPPRRTPTHSEQDPAHILESSLKS